MKRRSLKLISLTAAVLLAGCAAGGPLADPRADAYKAEIERLNAQLSAANAERQRLARAAARREEALRRQLEATNRQLDAMKSIERGILERDERLRTETR